MSSGGKIIHKQNYQNAQQIIEVTVKAKPKTKFGLKTKTKNFKPFERNCLLSEELERVTKELEAKRSKIKDNKMNPERPMPKLKINSPKMILEIEKKSKQKRKEKANYYNLLLKPQERSKTPTKLPDSEQSNLHLEDKNVNKGFAQKDLKMHGNCVDERQENINVDEQKLIEKKKHIQKAQEKRVERILDTFPPEATWEDVLRACSSTKTSNSSKSSLSSEIENVQKKVKDPTKLHKNYIDEKNHLLPKNADPNPGTYSYASSYVKSRGQKGVDKISNQRYDTTSRSGNQYNAPMILPANAGKPLYINKSIQTSVISIVEHVLDHPDSKQSDPKNFPMKTPTDHTHSPCSESALKILQQLRDRVYSKGDGKCTELVIALEACLSVEGKSARHNFEDAADSGSPLFPDIYMQKVPPPLMDFEKQRLERVIDEQKRKIAEDKDTIEEFRSLLTQFMTYLQQINDQIIEPADSARSGHKPEKREEERKADITVLKDLNDSVRNLMTERDAFMRENRKLRDVILHLEVKMSQIEKERDTRREKQNSFDALLANHFEPGNDGHLPRQSPLMRSDGTDSAYEEKSYKSSASSKTSSNINRSSGTAQENKIPAIISEHSGKPLLPSAPSKRPVLSELLVYTNRSLHNGDNPDLKKAKLPMRGVEKNSFHSFDNCYQPSDHEKSSICGVPEENISDPYSKDFRGNMFSETSDYCKSGIYLESTHVNDKRKDNPLSSKRPIARNRFEPHLSRITSEASDSDTRLTSVRIESE